MNNLNELMELEILPMIAERFRKKATMARLVHIDSDDEVRASGDTLGIQIPSDMGEMDILPQGGTSTSTDYIGNKVNIVLDNHGYKQFEMSDREISTHVNRNTLPDVMSGAVDSVANGINLKVIDLYKQLGNSIGTSTGASKSKKEIIQARKKLQGVAPQENRYFVMSPETEADFLSDFSDFDKNGEEAQRLGLIGNKYGFGVTDDVCLPEHVAGDADSYTADAAVSGATQVVVANGTGTFNVGDLVSFAGTKGTYAVATELTGAGTLELTSALLEDVAQDSAVSVEDSHYVDLAFHKSAFALAFRQLEIPENTPGADVYNYVDPVTGIPMRVVSWYDPAKTTQQWKFEVLFGTKLVRPTFATRVLNVN